ncbi:MAG: Coenzyme F420 hydrogenase/dehydrogenase, beta subunit C-terminal domain [Phycisphaerae bacterium]|jgi:coenzyme F420 hydrogenase subunit beta|nr:Coenzyme F420 hydrogenase/dehydrogenase, beta subunit C-terminal domain [Phycisphaerae bacterium]
MTDAGSKQQNIDAIVKAGLCTGCGMCYAVCPERAVGLDFLDKGWFQARTDEELCTDCGLCLKVCGRNHQCTGAQCHEPERENEYAPFLGNFESCHLGHSTDINIRWNAASGGLITSILAFCFREDLVDCAIVAASSAETPLISRAVVATTEEEILQASGSRYAPIPMNAAVKEALALGGRVAVVGLPCHIQSLRRATVQLPELKDRIALQLGMFCSHNVSSRATDFVLRRKGLRTQDILEFNYRGKGWPSGIRIRTRNDTIAYLPNANSVWTSLFSSFVYSTPYCLSCTEQTNELADISFGDAWLPDVVERDKIGRSICIARTETGSSILEQARDAKAITLTDLEPRRVAESQAWPLYFKKINVACRTHRYPQDAIKIDGALQSFRLTKGDRLVSLFARFSSAVSSCSMKSKYINYIVARLLLLFAKPYNKILRRRTEKFRRQYLTTEQRSHKQTPLPTISPPPAAVGDTKKKCTNVVVVNQHGANRGDEAALKGMLYGLKKLIPDAKFTVLTMTPSEDFKHIAEAEFIDTVTLLTKKRTKLVYFTLAALAYRLGLGGLSRLFGKKPHFMETLKAADLVVSAPGGPYIGDMYQTWELSCAFQIYVPVLLGKPVMIYAPSQGPFDNEKRNRWRKWLLSRVDVISLRDDYSKVHLANLGIDTSPVHVTVDSCLQKPVDKSLSRQIIRKEGIDTDKMLIGVVPLHSVPFLHEAESLDVQDTAAQTIELLADVFDANFLILPQRHGLHRDLPSMIRIAHATELGEQIHVLNDTYDSDQQQSLIGRCDLLISFRYHPFIFGTRQAVPSVCVAYEHKALGFARIMNLEEYCLDLFSTTPEEIVAKAQQAWNHKEVFKNRAESHVSRLEGLSLRNSEIAAGLLKSSKEQLAF